MSAGGSVDVAVVGSLNLDLSVTVDALPAPGETVMATGLLRGGGGKGANQAVAAARLGRSVAMIGRVGDDETGGSLLSLLRGDGIDVGHVRVTDGVPSGMALIEVESSGENRIVVVPGANATVDRSDLDAAADALASAPVVLVQMEVPVDVVEALAARPREGRLLVNPAPAVPGVDLDGVDVLIPNRGELAALTGWSAPSSAAEVVDQIARLPTSIDAVVVTLGAQGSLVVEGRSTGRPVVTPVAAEDVDAVDSTAAGDAYCGGLADALCRGAELVEAARWAGRVAAVTVTRRGAQDSLPTRREVEALG